ncbi:MAG: hypothetical protein PV340_02575 [Wolbachia sp.]|nr:hypothetical protein [Wolbachia sp.]MDD9335960.1 hypothetical protein [Wolbachia sp.]
MSTRITEEYQLRIIEGQSIRFLYESDKSPTTKKFSNLRDNNSRLSSILTSISKEVIHGIHDNNKFTKKIYGRLIDNLLNIAAEAEDHPLHEEFNNFEGNKKQIKEQVNKNSRHEFLKECMEYAANKDHPNTHIISILIVNCASLLASDVIDHETNQSITVKERLQKLGWRI